MYYYIYRISDRLKYKLKESTVDFLNSFNNNLTFEVYNNIIKGYLDCNNDALIDSVINFEIDLEYKFLFIETNYQYILNKIIEFIESFFNEYIGGELENFFPSVSKEHKLICESKSFNLKFLHNGKLIDEDTYENLEEMYCNNDLDKSYSLIEADIQLNNNDSFMYFRKALKINKNSSKDVIFDRFKQVMA